MTMKDPAGKSTNLNAEKTREAGQRRLEIQPLRPVVRTLTSENQTPAVDPHSSVSRKEEKISTSGEGEGSSGSKKGRGLVYGHVAMIGRRRVMEDAMTLAPSGWLGEEYYFFAVYDGHGGVEVAEKCREKMHKCLEKHIEKAKTVPKGEDFDWEKLMMEGFSTMDEELEEDREDRAAGEERMVGSTAVVVLVGKEELVVANCGDSRAVLCRSGVPVALSRDHKSQPDRADEKERVEAAGGKVINWNGWRVQGVLATSRSFGDHYLKPYVTSKPEVTVMRRSESDDFLIIATDGLFDVVCNEIACKVVKKCLSGKRKRRTSDKTRASEAAATLAQLAIVKGSKDNISIIVVQLK